MEKNRKNPKRRLEIIISIVSIAILVMVVSFSYAYIKYDEKEAGYNEIGTNCIKIKLEDYNPEIKLQNAYPVPDSIGKNTKPYQFTITNECDVPVTYQVNLEVFEESTMNAKNNIAVLFDENEKKHVLGTDDDSATPIEAEDRNQIKESYKIGESSVRGHETNYHKIVLWLDESAGNETQEKTFKCRVAIEAKQDELAKYTEPLLNGADPVITGELIPVEINEEGKAIKADPKEKWYSYGEKKWANAVILNDSGKEKVYGYGEEIPESEIESYFVWIPKYSYRLFNMGNYETATQVEDKGSTTAIEIHFGLDNTVNSVDECETPMNEDRTQGLSGESGTCKEGKLMTHPAFISFDVNGLWVGKFEASQKPSTTTPQVKPNQYSWRNINVSTMYTNSYNYKRDLDSHMMKNTEWGAVAYLTQSLYGRCTEKDGTTTCENVTINSSSNFVTGYAATNGFTNTGVSVIPGQNSTNIVNYFDKQSVLASTTNNYSGIYDMSGGILENVMGVLLNNSGVPFSGHDGSTNSGFNGPYSTGGSLTNGIPFPSEKKYYDEYKYGTTSSDTTAYSRRILGDATAETAGWYGARKDMVGPQEWFVRGAQANCGSQSWCNTPGPFFMGYTWGHANSGIVGFRVVLAPR